jgi:hypothetical protein
MSADRELLELAAKAAGLDAVWDDYLEEHAIYNEDGVFVDDWNPLTDDCDALRLAVKLNTCLKHHYFDGDWYVMASHENGWSQERAEPDQYAATRRAIVRAAAEIGKATGGKA